MCCCSRCFSVVKGILTDHFGGGSRVVSIDPYSKFFSHFTGISSQDQQKTNRRRLIISKVNLTGQSDFMRIFVLRKVTLRDYTNSVQ